MFEVTQEVVNKFLSCQTRKQISEVLQAEYKLLLYNIFKVPSSHRYHLFLIKKKNGDFRQILSPNTTIKITQRRLNLILQEIYPPKSCVHGFNKTKTIVTNAKQHINKKYLINIDLKDFFPSINFGRVRGLFQSYPFYFNNEVSTFLAQICCFMNILPQGAPSSPIISNFICRHLDNELLELCIANRCHYSRYADDITISTNMTMLPQGIGIIYKNEIQLSKTIIEIVKANGFIINSDKLRFACRNNRQQVTGLNVNRFVNVSRTFIRNVRSMLHAWEKYGLHNAAIEHFEKYNTKRYWSTDIDQIYERKIIGKIGFIGWIRGKDDCVFKNLYTRINKLSPGVKIHNVIHSENDLPIVFGEGKTDWKHFKAALNHFHMNNQFKSLNLDFKEYDDSKPMNNEELLKICETVPRIIPSQKIICIFDRDVPKINHIAMEPGKEYKYWGGNVYSFILPKPGHRTFDTVCIEHLYLDSELWRKDSHGRRLFLSTEFSKKAGKHMKEQLIYTDYKKLQRGFPFIIDNSVFNIVNEESMALSKEEFASNILNQVENFNDFTFEHFVRIFEIIEKIGQL